MFRPLSMLHQVSRFQICRNATNELLIKRFAGHSKWANIKHIKALKDGQKANIFSKYARMIRIAIQDGGSPNPTLNSYLRTVIDQALKQNMPMSTINNQIKKFNVKDAQLKRHFFELTTLNKINLLCEVYTENLPGLKQSLNTVIRKEKCKQTDCMHLFDEVCFVYSTKAVGASASESEFEEKLTEDAIECDAQEVECIDFASKSVVFLCHPRDTEKMKRALITLGYTIENTENAFVAHNTTTLTEEEAKVYESLKNRLKNSLDGFENIFDNVEEQPPA